MKILTVDEDTATQILRFKKKGAHLWRWNSDTLVLSVTDTKEVVHQPLGSPHKDTASDIALKLYKTWSKQSPPFACKLTQNVTDSGFSWGPYITAPQKLVDWTQLPEIETPLEIPPLQTPLKNHPIEILAAGNAPITEQNNVASHWVIAQSKPPLSAEDEAILTRLLKIHDAERTREDTRTIANLSKISDAALKGEHKWIALFEITSRDQIKWGPFPEFKIDHTADKIDISTSTEDAEYKNAAGTYKVRTKGLKKHEMPVFRHVSQTNWLFYAVSNRDIQRYITEKRRYGPRTIPHDATLRAAKEIAFINPHAVQITTCTTQKALPRAQGHIPASALEIHAYATKNEHPPQLAQLDPQGFTEDIIDVIDTSEKGFEAAQNGEWYIKALAEQTENQNAQQMAQKKISDGTARARHAIQFTNGTKFASFAIVDDAFNAREKHWREQPIVIAHENANVANTDVKDFIAQCAGDTSNIDNAYAAWFEKTRQNAQEIDISNPDSKAKKTPKISNPNPDFIVRDQPHYPDTLDYDKDRFIFVASLL